MNNLAAERKRKNISQKEMAKQLKISNATLSRWEKGISPIPDDKLVFFSNLYNCNIEWLLGLTDIRRPVRKLGFEEDPQ